jgi:hypothetical protein
VDLPSYPLRRFQLWRFEIGHSQLLFRSVKTDDERDRIDVLFKSVDRIDCPAAFTGLVVSTDGGDPAKFTLATQEGEFKILAGAVFHAVDGGEYFDPSPFAASLGGSA